MKTSITTVVLTALCAPVVLGQAGLVREAALVRIPLARTLASDPELLQAVRDRNAAAESLDEVRRKDAEWTANPKYPLRRQLTSSPCAERLRELTQAEPMVIEVILMDARGANVCASRETSDYWQGDEPKFQRTYGADKEVYVDEPALDASTGTYGIQLSVLVKDGKAKAGALTLTMRVRKDALGDPGPKR